MRSIACKNLVVFVAIVLGVLSWLSATSGLARTPDTASKLLDDTDSRGRSRPRDHDGIRTRRSAEGVWREPVLGPLTDDGSDPGVPRQRVVKGGDFTCGPDAEDYFGCTCESRSWNYLGNASFGTGFRVVIEPDQVGSIR